MISQKDSDPSKKDNVVLLLQDMVELVTRDMMVKEIRLVDAVKFIALETLFTKLLSSVNINMLLHWMQ